MNTHLLYGRYLVPTEKWGVSYFMKLIVRTLPVAGNIRKTEYFKCIDVFNKTVLILENFYDNKFNLLVKISDEVPVARLEIIN